MRNSTLARFVFARAFQVRKLWSGDPFGTNLTLSSSGLRVVTRRHALSGNLSAKSPRPPSQLCFLSWSALRAVLHVGATIKLVAAPTGSSSIRYLRCFRDRQTGGYIIDERYKFLQRQLGPPVQQQALGLQRTACSNPSLPEEDSDTEETHGRDHQHRHQPVRCCLEADRAYR